jgi:hypothetical protein
MKRRTRIVATAVATMALAVLAAPGVAGAADHHVASTTASGRVVAIGWPGDDAKPGHDPC